MDELARARRQRTLDDGLWANGFVPPAYPLYPLRPMKPTVEMPGHSTEARRIAKAKVEPHTVGQRGVIYRALVGHGRMTRSEIVEVTALRENSVNARVSELVKLKRVRAVGIDPASGRSILEAIQEVSP